MLYYIHLSGQPDRIKRSIRIELPKVNCSEYKQEGVFMQKTEYGYRRAVRIGIICLIFTLCMGKYAFGSVVVDEVLIGGQEEQAPVDAAPAAQNRMHRSPCRRHKQNRNHSQQWNGKQKLPIHILCQNWIQDPQLPHQAPKSLEHHDRIQKHPGRKNPPHL